MQRRPAASARWREGLIDRDDVLSPTPIERFAHCGEDLIDGNHPILTAVAGGAVFNPFVAERDIHHREYFIHGHHAVTAAVTDALEWRRCR